MSLEKTVKSRAEDTGVKTGRHIIMQLAVSLSAVTVVCLCFSILLFVINKNKFSYALFSANTSSITLITDSPAPLTVLKDTEAPVIYGVKELTMKAGGSISYKQGIEVTDNHDENVTFDVDIRAVDTKTPGDYPVIYTAADAAGNVTSIETVLHVLPADAEVITEEIVNAEADKLLAEILTDDMSQYQKAEVIFWWCHNNIKYSDNTPKGDWVDGAYRGIVKKKGDCFTYASSAKCLLTRAGIPNMDIERIPDGDERHYWNLIDIGEGWYHFDTCLTRWGDAFFYKTDAEIKEFSDTHDGRHNYDRSKYPRIQ